MTRAESGAAAVLRSRRWRRALPRSTAPTPRRTTRDRRAAPGPRGAARLPGPARRPERRGEAGHRAGVAAVHDRGVQRDAHRRAVRGPRGAPPRRPVRDRPVRGLPGRGHARRAPTSAARTPRGSRASGPGQGDDPVAWRVFGPRRRARGPSTGWATSSRAADRATRASRRRSSSSTATRPRRRPCHRR